MLKKSIAIVALITAGMMVQAPIASAHKSSKYHSHKNQVQKHHGKKKYGNKHHNRKARKNVRKFKRIIRRSVYGKRLPQIRRQLRNRGYYRINYTDRRLPVYKARACKNGKRFNMRINRWGGIMWRKRIGWCR